MRVTLDPKDLRPEFQKEYPGKEGGVAIDQAIATSLVKYEHLNEAAQAAVRAAGSGTFETWDKRNYNAVYPPSL